MELEGLILLSREFGYCKITAHVDQRVRLRFCGSKREAWYNGAAIQSSKDFQWEPLPAGLKCEVEGRGVCVIKVAPLAPSKVSGIHEYRVEFDNESRDTAVLDERALTPIPGSLSETPLTRITSLTFDPVSHFVAREKLRAALLQHHRETSGIHALASSRIDLLPHQAFVVGTVIDDPVCRYILADEVGLGKTVEAGAIAHQLLSTAPGARVLILCPGPLARQWLCEMHMSFGGRDFHLADLHPAEAVPWIGWHRVISSLKVAMRYHREAIKACHWDLIIVDEAHHLLWNDSQYNFVSQLSAKAGGVLLLSAIPARERESDLLRLLQLILPEHYAPDRTATLHFPELYAAQPIIGRRLRILSRALEATDQMSVEELLDKAARLLASPVISADQELAATYHAMDTSGTAAAMPVLRRLRDEITSRFRISRRIIKNRRSRLIDSELLAAVERRIRFIEYVQRPLEREISSTLETLLSVVSGTEAHRGCLHGFLRKSLPALCDPVASLEIVTALRCAPNTPSKPLRPKHFDSGLILDYDEHDALLEFFSEVLRAHTPSDLIDQLIDRLEAWIGDITHQPRFDALVTTLEEFIARGLRKIVVFAGTFRTCEFLEKSLSSHFGPVSFTIFRHDQDDEEKERSVTRFRRSPECTFLICDESGGEGRNFQFADALVHYDLPWSVAALEQRIGRLDRIGRTAPVESVVLVARDTLEWAWATCLTQGFKVFEQSISGLEFTLRTAESEVIEAALRQGSQGVLDCVEDINTRCEAERAADDADAITDASSFKKESRYLRTGTPIADRLLEEAFPPYFRSIARGEAAKQVADNKDPNLKVWRLQPERISGVRTVGLEKASSGGLPHHIGTFSRVVARERRDLEFFSTGNALFDAIASVSHEHVRGRNYAVQLTMDDIGAGNYLMVALTPSLAIGVDTSANKDSRLGRAERYLYGRQLRCAIDLYSGAIMDRESVGKMYAMCTRSEATLKDLPKASLMKAFAELIEDWPQIMQQRLHEVDRWAQEEGRRRFEAIDEGFVSELEAERHDATQLSAPDLDGLVAGFQVSIDAVRHLHYSIDSIGLLINTRRRVA